MSLPAGRFTAAGAAPRQQRASILCFHHRQEGERKLNEVCSLLSILWMKERAVTSKYTERGRHCLPCIWSDVHLTKNFIFCPETYLSFISNVFGRRNDAMSEIHSRQITSSSCVRVSLMQHDGSKPEGLSSAEGFLLSTSLQNALWTILFHPRNSKLWSLTLVRSKSCCDWWSPKPINWNTILFIFFINCGTTPHAWETYFTHNPCWRSIGKDWNYFVL